MIFSARQTFRPIAIFTGAAILTAAGFFLDCIPFFVAYLPFVFAMLSRTVWEKFLFAAGHFIWPAVISGWGLIQLEYALWYIVPAGFLAAFLASGLTSGLGVGIAAVILGAIPFIPDSPLLVSGSVMPSLGIWGLLALAVSATYIERLRALPVRLVLIAALLTIPRGVVPALALVGILPAPAPQERQRRYIEVDTSDIAAITRVGRWHRIAERIEEGSSVVLGENIFDYTDIAATSYWCRTITAKSANAFIGVRGPDGSGEVWHFTASTCPSPARTYRARFAIPTVTGGWTPRVTDWSAWITPTAKSQWLVCFEGFILWRWLGVGLSHTPLAIVLSNDRWTAPIPVGVLRRKVGREFAKLFDIDVYFAETGKNALVLASPSASAPVK